MTSRYCTYCGDIIADEARLRRGSAYCGDTCKRAAQNERKAKKLEKTCRLCGRGVPRASFVEERKLRRKLAEALSNVIALPGGFAGAESVLAESRALDEKYRRRQSDATATPSATPDSVAAAAHINP